MVLHDPGDDAHGQAYTELEQLALDAPVAPSRVLLCQAHYECGRSRTFPGDSSQCCAGDPHLPEVGTVRRSDCRRPKGTRSIQKGARKSTGSGSSSAPSDQGHRGDVGDVGGGVAGAQAGADDRADPVGQSVDLSGQPEGV